MATAALGARSAEARETGSRIAVGRQRRCHSERTVARIGSNLQRALRSDQAHEQAEKRALVGADLHAGAAHRRGLSAQTSLKIRLAGDDSADIILDGLRQQGAERHGGSSNRKGVRR